MQVKVQVALQSSSTLYGLIERASATESLGFLVTTFKDLEHRLALLLPRAEQHQARTPSPPPAPHEFARVCAGMCRPLNSWCTLRR